MESLFFFIILIFSVVIHEVSHGYAAKAQGDQTAEYAGRLTLNPIPHLDPIGSIILPISMFLLSGGRGPIFGWAKPVPFNPWNLRNLRWGPVYVALAGPGANFMLATVFGLLIRFLSLPEAMGNLFEAIVFMNLFLGMFNLVPIPPLDGSKLLFAVIPDRYRTLERFLEQYGILILFMFIFTGLYAQLLLPAVVSIFRFLTGTFSPF
jgi:Zn-dependent protease